MGDTNRVALYAVKEDTWGVTPKAKYNTLRMTGESIGFRVGTTVSNELRDDRQISDLIQVSAQNDGGINFELSYGSYDDLLASVLYAGDWVGVGGGVTNVVFTSGATASNLKIDIAVAGPTFTFGSAHNVSGLVKGQQFTLWGSTAADGTYTVVSVVGQVVTVVETPAGSNETLDETQDARIVPLPKQTIVSTGTANETITFATGGSATDNKITIGSALTCNILAGQKIKVSGSANTGNNGYHLVTAVDATGKILTCAGSTFTAEIGDADPVITIKGARIRNGVTRTSFTLEKKFGDMSPAVYATYTGMIPGSMSVTLESGAVFNGSFTFLGKSATIGTSSAGTGTPAAASTTNVMNATADLAELRENYVAMTGSTTCFLQSMGLTVENNLRGKPAIGVIGNCDVGAGRFNVNGTLAAYFTSKTLYEKYVNSTSTSISFIVDDAAGNAYEFFMPNVKFSNGNIVAGGADADVIAELEYQAILDDTYPFTLQICKFPA